MLAGYAELQGTLWGMRSLWEWWQELLQRPAVARFLKISELLLLDAAIAIVNMLLIFVVSGVAHILHLDSHHLFQGLTVADIFRLAHAANILITLGFGLYHLIKELKGHP